MSRGRRRRAELEASAPASTQAFWVLIVNGLFALLFAGAGVGFGYLVWIGWWRSPVELLVFVVLELTAIVGCAFFVDGIRRDIRDAGWTARGEFRNLGQRARRGGGRPGGRESFASQRFTGNARRRR